MTGNSQKREVIQIFFWVALGAASVTPILLKANYQGNPINHFIMQIAGAFLAVSVAILAFNCSLDRREGFMPYIGAAFLAAGLTDLLHALFSMGILIVPHAALDRFIPGAWTAGRVALGVILLLGLVRTHNRREYRPSTGFLALTTTLIVCAMLILFTYFPLPAFILPNLWFIHRPWEYMALVLFVACFLFIIRLDERRLAPARSLLPSLVLGVIAQLLMALSPHSKQPSRQI